MAKRAQFWKCYPCNYVGPAKEFRTKAGRRCPKEGCVSPEDVFPYRMYRCKGCGTVGDQDFWFDEPDLDGEPLTVGDKPKPCRVCFKKLERKLLDELADAEDNGDKDMIFNVQDMLANADGEPAKLEEIPVPLAIKK